jgi:hypothetical protein
LRTLATVISMSVWTLFLTLFPVTGLAHTLEAPDTVLAVSDGSFTYKFVFRAGPGSAIVAAIAWQGVQNAQGGGVADCFCSPGCLYDEGESFSFPVEGSLLDHSLPGVFDVSVEFCDEPGIATRTTILPAGPVPVRRSTWGAIKSLYAIESLYK